MSYRSKSGFLIYVSTAVLQWFSQKQSTVAMSVICAKFVTMKQGIDALQGLRYKLRMMTIPISSLSYIYVDNMSVLHNSSGPESVFRKKSNAVCYYAVHESLAMGESIVGHIPSKENVADLLTKVLYGHKRRYLVSNIVYDMHHDY